MAEFDTEKFAKAFATGLAEAMGQGEAEEAAPSPADLAKAVRENPELDVEKIVERWESMQPEPQGTESKGSQADKTEGDKTEGKPKTTIEDLFTKATANGSTTKSDDDGKLDIMGDDAKRLKSLEALFS